MGQLVLGAVGAVVGGYFGGPAGASLGWAVGSAIGGVAFAPDGPQTTGPRLTDLQSNVSTYGQPIARAYGQIGFMGSLIWLDEIKEAENVDEIESKGGDPATVTTFTYSASFAMILCRGEVSTIPNSVAVQALNRIWVNEKCVYDVRDEANLASIAASNEFSQYFTFYPGNQTQEPDPTMEAVLGVGNVPAYRGRAYCVFTDFPLALVQNQPPGALRITFEVVMSGTPVTGLRQLERLGPAASAASTSGNLIMPVREGVVRVVREPPNVTTIVNSIDGVFLLEEERTPEEEEWPSGGTTGYVDGSVAVTRLYDGSNVRTYQFAGTYAVNNPSNRLYASVEGGALVSALPLLLPQTAIVNAVVPCADQRHIFVITSEGAGPNKYHKLEWIGADAEWSLVSTGTIGTNAITAAPGPASQGAFYSAMAESDQRHLWWLEAGSGALFRLHYIDDAGELALIDSLLIDNLLYLFAACQIWVDNGTAYAFAGGYYYVVTRNPGAAVNDQTLDEVFEAECALAGLVPGQVNATALEPIPVDGMFIRRLGSTRAVIGALEPSYFFDTVESADTLKAVLRGGASTVTITDDELGASVDGTAEEDLINPERTDEDSLPGEAVVTYIDRASDYQVAAQHDRRSAVATDQPVNLEMPLVFSPDEARQIASVWMYNQWAGRTRRVVRVSRKYSYLEPTDVITLRTDTADFVVRIVSLKTNDGYLELECVDEDAALYTQNAEGAIIDQGSDIETPTPTKLVLLDVPMLRESDNDPGFYLAAAGYSTTWPGAVILRSTDGGVTYKTVASITRQAVIGNVPLALGDFTGPMGYDSVNSIVVSLFSTATLQSCTDQELLEGANAFAIGSTTAGYEIAQFKTATLVSGNIYRLTQLLRGRRGTEHEMAGHGTYETFVLLDPSKMRRIAIDNPAIGLENHYKAPTFGQLAINAQTQAFTNTAASLKPYSPVDIRARLSGSLVSDILLTWSRRGRLYNDWRDGIDLPLGEATESYETDIYDGATVVRTIASVTPSVTYTRAQQVADFDEPQTTLTVKVYQLSAIVGRGFPGSTTLTGFFVAANMRLSSGQTYIYYIKGPLPSDMPAQPLAPVDTAYLTLFRLRYTGFVVDVQAIYSIGSAGGGVPDFAVMRYDDGMGSSIGDDTNGLTRTWISVGGLVKDDGAATFFFVAEFFSGSGHITRFEANLVDWSTYYAGTPTQVALAASVYTSITSISTALFAFAVVSSVPTIKKYTNTTLVEAASWSMAAGDANSKVFKSGSDLWYMNGALLSNINQSTGAVISSITTAGAMTDAVAVGGYAYVYIPSLQKVKKYLLSSGVVQAFEYSYTDDGDAYLAVSDYLILDGTLLSIGRAKVDAFTGLASGTIVVLETTTDTFV